MYDVCELDMDTNIKLDIKFYQMILFLGFIAIAIVGCSSDSDEPSTLPPPDPIVYTGKTEMADITIDNAGYLLSRLFNTILSGHPVGREKVLATELEELPLMSTEFLTSVIDSVNTGITTTNICDSGNYTIDNISGFNVSIVDMRCQLNLAFTTNIYYYRPRYFWSENISVIVNSNSTNRVEASMDFDFLHYSQAFGGSSEATIYLGVTGSYSNYKTLS